MAGIDILLVGDSVGMVVHGHDTTLPVTLEDILVHCKAVFRGTRRCGTLLAVQWAGCLVKEAVLQGRISCLQASFEHSMQLSVTGAKRKFNLSAACCTG